ncbi:MAG TPA: hypothetical protein DCF44_09465 [Chitinophagaceae bacterium]|nr:hypothetical protein [Chitinophagaceae bacterium]
MHLKKRNSLLNVPRPLQKSFGKKVHGFLKFLVVIYPSDNEQIKNLMLSYCEMVEKTILTMVNTNHFSILNICRGCCLT